MANLGLVVRTLREDAHLTQEELAERSGLSGRTISDIERGLRRRVYADTAERLAAALNLSGPAREEFVGNARGRESGADPDLDVGFRRRFIASHVRRVEDVAGQVGREDRWFAALGADEANVEVALRWAKEASDGASLLRLAVGAWQYWQARGALAQGRSWLERGLELGVDDPLRVRALWASAWLALEQGDDTRAQECARGLAAAGTSRNSATVSGMVALAGDRVDDSLVFFQEALSLADQPWLTATSHLNLAMALIAAGQPQSAQNSLGHAIRRYEELGDERFRARCLGYLGLAALSENQPQRARSLYSQCLAAFDALGEPKGTAEGLAGLAAVVAGDDPLRSATLAGATERLREGFSGRPLAVDERLITARLVAAEQAADPSRWSAAWTLGRAMRLQDAVALALN